MFLVLSDNLPSTSYSYSTIGSGSATGPFDNNDTTFWTQANGGVSPHYIQVDLGSSYPLERFEFKTQDSGWISIGSFNIKGSNDGTTFTTIYNGNLVANTNLQNFNFTRTIPYRYVRFTFTLENGRTFMYVNRVGIGINVNQKALIKNNGQYLSYNGTDLYPIPTSNPSESDYLTYGLDDISVIPTNKWLTLSGDVELSYFTDSPIVNSFAEFEIETNQFNLLDELGNTPKILCYTDDPTTTPILTTEIEPVTLADELGETPELLYWTDDTSKTTASMEITANYTPLDEIEGDFDIVTWTDEVASDVTETKTPTFKEISTGGDLYATTIDLTKGMGIKGIQ